MWGLQSKRLYATSANDVVPKTLRDAHVAALLIDMQPMYVRRLWGPDRRGLIQSQREMLGFCAAQNIPTAIIEAQAKSGYTEDTARYLQDRIESVPRRTQPIKKTENNAFSNPDLAAALRAWDTTHVLVMGVNASSCVKDTAAGALEHGLQIMTADTLIADEQDIEFGAAIPWYQQNGTYCFDHRRLMQLLRN